MLDLRLKAFLNNEKWSGGWRERPKRAGEGLRSLRAVVLPQRRRRAASRPRTVETVTATSEKYPSTAAGGLVPSLWPSAEPGPGPRPAAGGLVSPPW